MFTKNEMFGCVREIYWRLPTTARYSDGSSNGVPENKVKGVLVHIGVVTGLQLELSDGSTRVHLESPAAGQLVRQTARVGPRRVAAREMLSKSNPTFSLLCTDSTHLAKSSS